MTPPEPETGKRRPVILVSNDDSVWSPGIQALAEAMKPLGEVIVSAPDREQSAMGHAVTMIRPLSRYEVRPGVWAWDGTPTDAVIMGVNILLDGRKPDLVVSGINHGANLGDDVTYSGTVSAAMEGAILEIPSVAFSLATKDPKADFSAAADVAADVARWVLDHDMPPDTLLNVNIPPLPRGAIKGTRLTVQGRRRFEQNVVPMKAPGGREVFWIGGAQKILDSNEHADFKAVADGYISITPLHLNMTNFAALRMFVHIPTRFDGREETKKTGSGG